MARRSSRSDALVDRPKLLGALGACRNEVCGAMAKMKASGPLYHSASAVLAAIDALALMLTGQRYYFHTQPHGGPTPQKGPE